MSENSDGLSDDAKVAMSELLAKADEDMDMEAEMEAMMTNGTLTEADAMTFFSGMKTCAMEMEGAMDDGM